jgi:hypothetical protein
VDFPWRRRTGVWVTLTLPSYAEEHRHANKIYQFEARIDGEQGVPENEQIVEGKLTPKEQAYPASSLRWLGAHNAGAL